MRAGRLRHRVTLQSATTTQNSYGEQVKAWVDVGTFWAAVEPISGKERFASGERIHERDVRIVMRYIGTVTETHRILFQSRTYDIKAVVMKDSVKREYEFICTEGLVPILPSALVKVSGDNQEGADGVPLTAMVVRVNDQYGAPMFGVEVTFSGGSVAPTSAFTDSGGLASTVLTPALGSNTVTATVTGLTAVSFTATGVAILLNGTYANPNITFTRASNKSYINFDGVLTTATTDEWPVEYSL